jgi:hypothetical protein
MNDYADIEQRVRRYWYSDGIVEIVGGGLSFLFGIYFIVQEMLSERSVLPIVLGGVFVLLLVSGYFITRRLINNLKTRITYPRTGYVDYSSKKRTIWRKMLTFGIALGVLAITIAIGRQVGTYNWVPAFIGFLFGIVLVIVMIRKGGPVRFYLLATFSAVAGLALSFSGLNLSYSLGLFYGLVGIGYLISGGVTLRRYVRQNPIPLDVEGDHA